MTFYDSFIYRITDLPMRFRHRHVDKACILKSWKYVIRLPKRFHKKCIVKDHRFQIPRRIERRIVLRWLRPKPGEKILDVACGMGGWSAMVTGRGAIYFGLDASFLDVMKAKKRYPESHFINIRAEHSPFKTGAFHKVFSNCSIEHFEDDLAALRNIHDVLVNGGWFVITADALSPNIIPRELIEKHKATYDVVTYYTHESLRQKLEQVGFRVLDVKYYLTSGVSRFYYALGIRFGIQGWLLYLFPFFYPLVMIADYFSGNKKQGCGVAAIARKLNTHE